MLLTIITRYNDRNSKLLYKTYNAPGTILNNLHIVTKFNPYQKEKSNLCGRYYLFLYLTNMRV